MSRKTLRNRLPLVASSGALLAAGACMVVPDDIRALLALVAGAAGLSTATVAGAAMAWHGFRHASLVRALQALSVPALHAGIQVRELAGSRTPFVAGLSRPKIYSPRTLSAVLAADEMRAVLLHEERHVLHRAPARLLILAMIASLMPLPPVRAWVETERAKLEIDADQHALRSGAGRPTLASALIKLLDHAQPAGTAGFSTAAELRLTALLDDCDPRGHRRSGHAAWAIVVVLAIACVTVSLP